MFAFRVAHQNCLFLCVALSQNKLQYVCVHANKGTCYPVPTGVNDLFLKNNGAVWYRGK